MTYKITMFSDFLWPYCHIGKGIVEELKKEFDIEVIHRGFEIHPDVPVDGMLLTDYFPNAGQMFGQLKSMGALYGVQFNSLTMMPNTNKALQVAEYAKEVNKSHEYNTAMYKATFEDDINISLDGEIKKIAASAGITNEEVDQVFRSSKYRDILEFNKTYCRENNIQSVPTFIINDEIAVVGAQGPDQFRNIFNKLKTDSVIF